MQVCATVDGMQRLKALRGLGNHDVDRILIEQAGAATSSGALANGRSQATTATLDAWPKRAPCTARPGARGPA